MAKKDENLKLFHQRTENEQREIRQKGGIASGKSRRRKKALRTALKTKKSNGGSRHSRLDNTRKLKRFRSIICSDACVHCIEELQNLTYATDRDGEIIPDEFNRAGASFRAVCMLA